MIKLVAFDWNGTILADTFTSQISDNLVLKKFGLPEMNLKKFQETFDVPISKYWKAMGFSEKKYFKHHAEIEKIFTEQYGLLENKFRTRKGLKALLSWLQENKIDSIIYSNHHIPGIQRQLVRLKMETLFKEVLAREVGDNSHLHIRSKEQKLANYVLAHKIKPKEVISVGDTEEEIEVGKARGYYTVAITGGYNSLKRLKAQNPDFIINNLAEIKNIIIKLNKNA